MPLDDYDPVFAAAGREWDVDPAILKAVAQQESRGNPGAVSAKGAAGLMGIMPTTGDDLGVTNRANAVQSIYGGAKYYRQMLDRYGKPDLALMAYNAGPGRLDAVLAGKAQLPDETKAYVPAVQAHYQQFSAAGGASMASANSDEAAGEALIRSLSGKASPNAPSPGASSPGSSSSGAGAGGGADDDAAVGEALVKSLAANKPAPAVPAAAAPDVDADGSPVWRDEGGGEIARRPGFSVSLPHSVEEARQMLAVKPGYQASAVGLPVRVKLGPDGKPDPNLGVEFDPLNMIRGPANALIDLAQGPQTGTVTPAASALLFGAAMGGGLAPSVARGSGAAIAEAAAARQPPAPVVTPLAPAELAQLAERQRNPLVAADRPYLSPAAADAVAGSAGNRLGAAPIAAATGPAEAEAGPSPGMGGPAPQPAGAQASTAAEAQLTPQQIQAYRSTAEGRKLLESQLPGEPDRNLYIPGTNPNTAEIEQSVNTARELKSLNVTAPEVSQRAKEIAAANNEVRKDYFDRMAGADIDVLNAKEARGAAFAKAIEKTWDNKGEADTSPIFDVAADIMRSGDSRRPIVRDAVNNVLRELQDSEGNRITDPEQIYGVRKHIDDLLSKENAATDPKSIRATAALQKMKDALDTVMDEKAAPGFQDAIRQFAEASRPIDAMEALQKHQNKLVDSQGRMTFNKVQTMMRQIVDSRAGPGINQYKSLSDDQMAQLWALRDDLRRSASAQELARTPGSDTAQNAWDMAKSLGMLGVEGAGHLTANAMTGPVGNALLLAGRRVGAGIFSARTARRQTARGMQLLHPDLSQLRNPLAPDQP
jgi:hypothetical protein